MFKYSCYIENSKEAREWLKIVGYEDSEYLMPIGEPVWSYLLTTKHGTFYSVPHYTVKTHIDCLGNLPLFKALTAVRDDSDYMQEFVCKISNNPDIKDMWHLCKRQSMDEDSRFFGFISFHKATKEELIEKF